MNAQMTSYLKVGRLADVLALIQLLAFDDSGYRSEAGMNEKLGRQPISAGSWIDLAKSHPEFFRVREHDDRTPRAALIIRYTIGKQPAGDEERRPQLTTEMASTFFNLAINLHDKQVHHRDRWKPWIAGLMGALLGAFATISAAYLKDTAPPSAIEGKGPAAASPHH